MPGVRGRPQNPEWVKKRVEARMKNIAGTPEFYKTLLRYEITNGATLCVACHFIKTQRDRKGG